MHYCGTTKQRLFFAALFLLPVLALVLARRYQAPAAIERVTLGEPDYPELQEISVARYEWAKQSCAGKTVADIASGSGYGINILRSVAARVDGDDKEPLGQEFVIDLEKESWDRSYDVIVSFETIEHLANPDFFLQNAANSCELLLLSTQVNEKPGANRFHKQFWTFQELRTLVERRFNCDWYRQSGRTIERGVPDQTAVASCLPKL